MGLEERRAHTKQRLSDLEKELTKAADIVGDKACVYITGSGGRGEMGAHSDLDLFIVSDVEVPKAKRPPGEEAKAKLRRLDAIVVKAELISATKKLQFPPFSGDGKYLETYTIEDLCENLGKAKDDQANTFTARLLLLLESKPLLGAGYYQQAINDVIAPYWKDYEEHSNEFRPAFLMNDIVRMWKTLCVNYEAYTEHQPDDKRAERKLKNYKLKHSRVLTCYSALLYLMQVFAEQQTVHPGNVQEMVKLSPTERLRWIGDREGFKHKDVIEKLFDSYEEFLDRTNKPEAELVASFMDKQRSKEFTSNAYHVGDAVMELLGRMGPGNVLYRYLMV